MATINDFIELFKSEISNKTGRASIAPLNFDNVFTNLSEVLTTISDKINENANTCTEAINSMKKQVTANKTKINSTSSIVDAIAADLDYGDSQGVKALYFWKTGAENVYYTGEIPSDGKIQYEAGITDISSYTGEIVFDGKERAVTLEYLPEGGTEALNIKIYKEMDTPPEGIIAIFDMKGGLYKIKFDRMLITKIVKETND